MMESVEIRGDIKDLGSKDGKTFALKLEAELEAEEIVDLYALQRNGKVVVLFQPAVEQKPLPMEKPAPEPPGQARLFGVDGRPRFRVRCESCHTETTQKIFNEHAHDGDRQGIVYECDVCHTLNLVESPESTDAVDKPADSVDAEAEIVGEKGETVDIAQPIYCPMCGSEMAIDLVEGEKPWLCVNQDCRHRYSNEEARELAGVGAEEPTDDGEKPILICPSCQEHEMVRGDDGDTWECTGCGHWISDDEANELLAEANHAEPNQDDDEGDDLTTEVLPAGVQLRQWTDPATGKVYEITQGLGSGWGLFERKPGGGSHRVRGVEYQEDREAVEAAAAEYAERHGWQEVAGDQPESFRPASGE